MLQVRVMPVLLLRERRLVKTIKFKNPVYVGDPVNAIKIYNEKEVDELIVLDITATIHKSEPDFELLSRLTDECFMPLGYGGGIRTLDHAKRLFGMGVEKIAINSFAIEDPEFISKVASNYGSQAVVASIDVKRTWLGSYNVYTHSATRSAGKDPISYAKELVDRGAGEILLTSVDREGTWDGFDLNLLKGVSHAVSVPVIALGGCGSVEHLGLAVKEGGASAVALGSMAVYQGKDLGVLIGFPSQTEIRNVMNQV